MNVFEEYEKPILITGCARSGTSMTSGILSKTLWGGVLAGPTKYNQKGMFENTMIRNNVIKPYLRSIGADPLGQYPLPDIASLLLEFCPDPNRTNSHIPDRAFSMKKKILNILVRQGYKGQRWFYKGAKMCLVWPLWVTMFPKAQWVIVRRKKEDIVNSCLKTGFMRAFDNAEGWAWWVDQHELRFNEMKAFGFDVIEVWPHKMVEKDFSEMQSLMEKLNLPWDEDFAKNFVDPVLWGGGKKNG